MTMIMIPRKSFPIRLYDIYFWDGNKCALNKIDIAVYHQSTYQDKYSRSQHTLLTDLRQSHSELYYCLKPNIRNEINRIEKRKISPPDITTNPNNDEIEQFSSTYLAFANKNNLPTERFQERLKNANNSGHLVISSFIYYENKTPFPLYHVYLRNKERTRLWFSYSPFREVPQKTKPFIGQLNRWMHWQEILHFKKNGTICFDWGGISLQHETSTIDKFKSGFGGKLKNEYTGAIGISPLGEFAINTWRALKPTQVN